MTEQSQLAQARIAGGWSREEGRDLSKCPTYCPGEQREPLRASWKEGWKATDARLRGEGK